MDIKGIIISGVLIVGAVGGTAAYYNHKEKNSIDLDDFEPVSVESTADEEDETESIIDEIIPEVFELSVENLKEIVEPASELVSAKYKYTNASNMENYKTWFKTDAKIPLTTTQTVFTYDGVISGGIDFSKIKYELDNETRTIVITLPSPYIVSHELDNNSFMFYDTKKSIFTKIEPDETVAKIGELKKNVEYKLLKDGDFLNSVNANAKSLITNFINLSDLTKDYKLTVNTTKPEPPEVATEPNIEQSNDEESSSTKSIEVEKASKYVGENYNTVITKLKDLGFTNILEPEAGDASFGFWNKSGDVQWISINGNDDFSKGDKFPPDAIIRIKYEP